MPGKQQETRCRSLCLFFCLPTVCGVPTCSPCTLSLCGAGVVNCTLVCPISNPLHPGRVAGHCEVHYKGTAHPTWTSGINTHSIIPKSVTYSGTWSVIGQAHLKVIKQRTPNEMHRHRHVFSPLYGQRLMCVRNEPALVTSTKHCSLPPPLS